MNKTHQMVQDWISNHHNYDASYHQPLDAGKTGILNVGTGIGDGLYIGDFPPANINTVNTWPNVYQPTITTIGTGGFFGGGGYGITGTGTYHTVKSLTEVLGDKAADYVIVPAAIIVGCGKEKHALADLLLKLNNVPFLELNGEIAVAPVVYNSILIYTKMGEEYAGMTLVDFLNQILAQE